MKGSLKPHVESLVSRVLSCWKINIFLKDLHTCSTSWRMWCSRSDLQVEPKSSNCCCFDHRHPIPRAAWNPSKSVIAEHTETIFTQLTMSLKFFLWVELVQSICMMCFQIQKILVIISYLTIPCFKLKFISFYERVHDLQFPKSKIVFVTHLLSMLVIRHKKKPTWENLLFYVSVFSVNLDN